MDNEHWARLPPGARDRLRQQLDAEMLGFASTPGGYASGVTGLLTTREDTVFVTAVPQQAPSAADYMIETRVARALDSTFPTPRLLHAGSAEGWVLVVVEAATGRMPSEPWEADQLLQVLGLLDELSLRLTPSPVRNLPTVADRMRGRCTTWTRLLETGMCGRLTAGDLSEWERDHLPRLARLEQSWENLVQGETLLHFDLRHHNVTHGVPAELPRRRQFSGRATLQWLRQRWAQHPVLDVMESTFLD